MSKTTIFLLVVFFIFVGLLLYILSNKNENPIITSLTKPIITQASPSQLSLSLSTNSQTVQTGQTVTVAILIHNPTPSPSLMQLELAYDPQAITITSLSPGNFFINPTIVLQKVDPATGRLSYALRCPTLTSDIKSDCINPAAPTVALITFTINPYSLKNTTTLSFLPKTVVRTYSGKDLLQTTSDLSLTITKSGYPIAPSSAIASPAGNYFRTVPTVK